MFDMASRFFENRFASMITFKILHTHINASLICYAKNFNQILVLAVRSISWCFNTICKSACAHLLQILHGCSFIIRIIMFVMTHFE
jgi:hypothetical protein